MVIGTGSRRRLHIGPRAYFTHPFAILAVLLLVGIFFAVIAVASWQRQTQYVSEGVAAQAVVVDKDTRTRVIRNRVQRIYEVTYTFEVDGQTIRNERSVDENSYHTLGIGDGIDIVYMPNDPTDNVPASYQSLFLPLLLGGAALLWNGFTVFYALSRFLRRG